MGNIRDKYKVDPDELNEKKEVPYMDSPSFAEDVLLYTELIGLEREERKIKDDDSER